MKIVPVSPSLSEQAIQLLNRSQLPVEDLGSQTRLFVMEEDGRVVGTIAAEHDHYFALLRSLSVEDAKRNSGIGKTLVDFIENYVKARGVKAIYLLTTTAAGFFARNGYTTIERSEVPPFIQQTSEYSSVCPSTATVMKKEFH